MGGIEGVQEQRGRTLRGADCSEDKAWEGSSQASIPSAKPTNASLVAQLVKNPPAMWETWVRFLGWEDPLEKGKAPLSIIPTWSIPWTV